MFINNIILLYNYNLINKIEIDSYCYSLCYVYDGSILNRTWKWIY